MDTKRIEELLEKYWLCETSVSEEEELRRYFLTEELPAHLAKYKAMFELQQQDAEPVLDEQFDQKILGMIQAEATRPTRRFTLSPLLKVAASIAIILGLWFSIQFINRQHNDPWRQDTYQTPEQALAEVQRVLSTVSGQIERGHGMVAEKMEVAEPLTSIIRK